mmetsp:Transcript_1478/g.1976  ORF Transcript_1478/g.1976 Transcript_1478/m.1976 type:complete len:114 (+) Transcript_1478:3-344(+)
MWNILGFLLFSIVTRFTYNSIASALEQGMDYEWYQDVFVVNLTCQFLVSFTNYGWYLYLVVPGYLLYQVSGYIKNWVFTPTADEMAADDPAAKKRQEKKEKKQERQKFKVMRG